MTTAHRSRLLFVLALVLTACSGGGDNGSSPTTIGGSATTTSPRASEPSTTTVDAEGPAEWAAVVQDIYNRRHDLLVERDREAVATVIDEDCACFEDELSTVEFLLEEGLRYESQPNQVLSVRVTGDVEEARLTFLQVRVRAFAVTLYRPDGTVFQESDPPPSGLVNLAVAPNGPDGEWRIVDLESAGSSEASR